MDSQTTNVIAYCSIVIAVGSAIITSINHRRIRSHCCGKELEADIDIENTTPPIRNT